MIPKSNPCNNVERHALWNLKVKNFIYNYETNILTVENNIIISFNLYLLTCVVKLQVKILIKMGSIQSQNMKGKKKL